MKKNGFTLIELLAVIVILAIITLISSPIIIGLLDNTKKESFKDSAYGIITASEYAYANELIKSNNPEDITFTYVDGVESSNIDGKSLQYNGIKPKSGNVIVSKDGKVAVAIHDGTYCAEKTFYDANVIISEKSLEECVIKLYIDSTGASIPVLSDGMVPIIWDTDKWVKADIYSKWYDYSAKEWANAVLVTNNSRKTYQNAAPGTELKEDDILAYFVWIPRYRYKLFNVEALSVPVQTIEIIFEDKNTGKSNGSTNGAWLTHPAFTFGTTELSGVWVGKFETTGDSTTPTVKPESVSLRNLNISTQFATAKLLNSNTIYGLTSVDDAHMLKNMEWGAVTYLSQSIYGKNSEIWKNPNSSWLTGCAGDNAVATASPDCIYPYTTAYGQEASTTGNMYGIYDMNSGAAEYIMGAVYNSDNTTIALNSTGFTADIINSTEMAKYIDKYLYGTTTTDQAAYNRRLLGDATGETRGWNDDFANFVRPACAWFIRGGNYNGAAGVGIFNFNYDTGINSNYAFRIAIAKLS